jgi:hypothetical protein
MRNLLEIESILDPNLENNNFEIFLEISTDLNNEVLFNQDTAPAPKFWTDSNYMKMARRVKNHMFTRNWNKNNEEFFFLPIYTL